VLRKAKIDPKYAILYLFYPPMFLFSRTLMSDIPAAVFVLLAFYLYQRGKHVGTGAALGLSFVIRYGGIALVPVFFVFALMKKKTEGVKVALGFLPFVLFVLLYNQITYGGALKTGYPGQALPFDLHRYGMHLLTYVISLSVFYPLMIGALFLYRKAYRREMVVSFVVMLVFLILSSFAFAMYASPSAKNIIKSSLLGVRYLFPVVPFLLLAYSSVCEKYLKKRGLTAVLIILVISSIAISRYHQGYLRSGMGFRDSLYSHTTETSLVLCNGEVTELVSIMWGKRNLMLLEDMDFSTLPERDVWVAVLLRLDKGNHQTIARVDSIVTRLDAELVDVLTGVDKEFRLYKAKPKNIRVPEYQMQMERRQKQKG
jgi:4-amino-4-deoxy-L-arabinose transferase-like glycosyltransferase